MTEHRSLVFALWCAATLSCGPSRRDRELSELRRDLSELQQHNSDLKLRLQLAEARNRVLIDLVQGLTTDPEHYRPERAQLATADASLRALEQDVDTLVQSVQHSARDVAALQAQRSQLQEELAQAKRTISEARATHAETDARVASLRAVVTPLIESIRSGRVNVSVQYGQLVLQLPEVGLFEAKSAQLSAAGASLLDGLAEGLASVPERQARVLAPPEGGGKQLHAQSEARVETLIAYLVQHGVPRERLIAASHSLAQPPAPLAPRFFEITLIPVQGDRAVPPTTEQLLETLQPAR